MSDKLRMASVEKTSLRLDVDALTKARLERLSQASGLSLNGYANGLIVEGLSKTPITEEDLKRSNQIIADNIANREANKAKKGVR